MIPKVAKEEDYHERLLMVHFPKYLEASFLLSANSDHQLIPLFLIVVVKYHDNNDHNDHNRSLQQ